MKQLENVHLEEITGGAFWDGFCGATAGAAVILSHPAVAASVAAVPGAGSIYIVTSIAVMGCFAYGYR